MFLYEKTDIPGANSLELKSDFLDENRIYGFVMMAAPNGYGKFNNREVGDIAAKSLLNTNS